MAHRRAGRQAAPRFLRPNVQTSVVRLDL